jgi:hypothetical protein
VESVAFSAALADPTINECCMARTQANKQITLFVGFLDPYRRVSGVPAVNFEYWG